jgi:hypothetical protein
MGVERSLKCQAGAGARARRAPVMSAVVDIRLAWQMAVHDEE